MASVGPQPEISRARFTAVGAQCAAAAALAPPTKRPVTRTLPHWLAEALRGGGLAQAGVVARAIWELCVFGRRTRPDLPQVADGGAVVLAMQFVGQVMPRVSAELGLELWRATMEEGETIVTALGMPTADGFAAIVSASLAELQSQLDARPHSVRRLSAYDLREATRANNENPYINLRSKRAVCDGVEFQLLGSHGDYAVLAPANAGGFVQVARIGSALRIDDDMLTVNRLRRLRGRIVRMHEALRKRSSR